MSLLRDHGHGAAGTYPVGRILDEAEIVARRENQRHFGRALTLQRVLLTIPNEAMSERSREKIAREFHQEAIHHLED